MLAAGSGSMTNSDRSTIDLPTDEPTQPTRRDLLKQAAVASGGLVLVNYLHGGSAHAKSPKDPTRPARSGPLQTGQPHRLEGYAKVTGAKLYGRDFRAQDLQGWPKVERLAVILRTPRATQVVSGLDGLRLRSELGDVSIVDGDALVAWGVEAAPPFLLPNFYVRSGSVPNYLGQAIALVSFKSAKAYLAAKSQLTGLGRFILWGEERPPVERPPYGTSRFVRYTYHEGKEIFSFLKDGPWSPPWEAPDEQGSPNAKASFYIEKIKADLANPAWQVFRETYATQSTDPMFMEPECGLSWFDSKRHTLHLTLGTQ